MADVKCNNATTGMEVDLTAYLTSALAASTYATAAHTHTATYQPKFVAAPAAANSTGVAGSVAVDSGYIYVCTATDTWKRVAIATWP